MLLGKVLVPAGVVVSGAFGIGQLMVAAFDHHAIIQRSGCSLWTPTNSGTLKTCSRSAFLYNTRRLRSTRLFETKHNKDGNVMKFFQQLVDPYPSKIPPELKKEIYDAEGNTEAAKGRILRIVIRIVSFLLFSFVAFQNALINELRAAEEAAGEPFVINADMLPGVDNLFSRFLFTTGIGSLSSVGISFYSLFSIQDEFNDRHDNAEKIYAELLRRRDNKKRKKKRTKPPTTVSTGPLQGRKKRKAALGEILQEDEEQPAVDATSPWPEEGTSETEEEAEKATKDEGIMGKLKGWYEKADNMAASQALLLNKELEDRGIVEKITDESGLKVIGKEAAEKLQESQESDAVSEVTPSLDEQ